MTPENFVYWLNGFIELENPVKIDERQTQEIKNHLALVLKKQTPSLNEILAKNNGKLVTIPERITLPTIPTLQRWESGNQTAENAREVLDKYSDSKNVYCMKDDVVVYQNMNLGSC